MFAVCAVPRCCDNAQGGHGSDDAGPAAALVLLGREHLMDNTTDSKARDGRRRPNTLRFRAF